MIWKQGKERAHLQLIVLESSTQTPTTISVQLL